MSAKISSVISCLVSIALLCAWPSSRAYANGDPFAGTHSVDMAYDHNISDGLTITLETTDVTFATSDQVSYTVTPPAVTMTRSANQLTLDPRPQVLSDSTALNTYALSNGTIGALLYTGRETADPNGLHARVGTWGTGISPTGAQLAGLWDGTLTADDDLATDPSAPFLVVNDTFTITDLGGNNIRVDFGGGRTVDATITGSTIVATDPAFEYFMMLTDGNTFVAAALDAEGAAAPGDISAGIAMATYIPEPATLGLLALGALALFSRRHRYRSPPSRPIAT